MYSECEPDVGKNSAPKVHTPDVLIVEQFSARPFIAVPAQFEHIASIGNLQGACGILLHQHDRDPAAGQFQNPLKYVIHETRTQSQGRFIQQHKTKSIERR